MFKKRLLELKDAIDSMETIWGRTLYVMDKTDTRYQEFLKNHEPYLDGVDKVYNGIKDAVSASSSFDQIRVAPGDYDEGAVVNVTQEGLKIIGSGNENQHHSMMLSSSASHHLMTINAHHVEIANMGFTQTKDTYDAIRVSTTAAFHKAHIHNCRFDGYGAGEYGIHTGTTYDSPDILVENNIFRSWQTVALHCNATRGVFRRNLIHAVAAKICIEYVPNAGDRPGSFITENDILGVNSTDTGIKITGTPNAGSMMIARNHICGCTTLITQKANNAYNTARNFSGDAAGGALIDTVA